MKWRKHKLLAKFVLTHAELQSIKGFPDKFMMAFSQCPLENELQTTPDSLPAYYRGTLWVSFSSQESSPVCNMHMKTRVLPQGHSSKLPVLSSMQGLQGQVPAVTWSQWPPRSLLLTFALTWHQKSGVGWGGGGGTSFPSQQQRACLQTLPGRLLGGRVWKKGEGEFIWWIFGIALALFSLTNKTGLGGNHITLPGTGFRKGLFDQHDLIICKFLFYFDTAGI